MLAKNSSYRPAPLALLLAVAFLFPMMAAAGSAQDAQRRARGPLADSKEVSNLLEQAKSQAAQLKNDATDMESFSRENLSWESHADKIMAIRADVNTIGETMAKLNAASNEASPWQKTAIDRVSPLLKELAENTTSIIDHLSKEQGRLINNQEHKDYLKANEELASDMSAMISDFVNYGNTRAKYMELRRNLEVSERGPRS